MGAPVWRVELFGGLRAIRYSPGALSAAAPPLPATPAAVLERFQTQRTGLLLAALALAAPAARTREELSALLWPDATAAAGRERLSQALYWLRQRLEGDAGREPGSVLRADRYTIRLLLPEAGGTDVQEFEDAVAEERWEAAAALYGGPFLAGYPEDEWVYLERQRFAETYRTVLREAARQAGAAGRASDAVGFIRRALREDPLDETVVAEVMTLLADQGDVAAALREFRNFGERLREALGEDVPASLAALAQTLRQQRTAPPEVAERAPSAPPLEPAVSVSPLPPSLTRFFGREEEIAALSAVLERDEERLLTLLGPGGSGKTRLALEAARRFLGQDPVRRAAFFVSLEYVPDSRRIIPAIFQAVRTGRDAAPPKRMEDHPALRDTLARHLAAFARPLLLLDNAEHLADEEGTPDVFRDLFARSPHLTVLVTARRALGLEGERRVLVPPLPVPPAGGASPEAPSPANAPGDTADPLMAYASVRLFVDRARQVRSDFDLTPENRAAVAALCARLEGLPLALELCAAWAATLTPDQMLSDLNNRFDLLVSRRRDLPERHRSLRAAVESSFLQLPQDLRAAFTSLAVFRGGWTADAAQAVQPAADGAPPRSGHAVMRDRLAQLHERSLIAAEAAPWSGAAGAGGAATRYRMLDTLREFAWDQLTEAERRRATAGHAAYYQNLVESASPFLTGPEQKRYLDLLEVEHDNFRAALQRLRERSADAALPPAERRAAVRSGLRMAVALSRFWQVRGYAHEGRAWLEWFLSRWGTTGAAAAGGTAAAQQERDEEEEEAARGWSAAGRLAWAQSDYATARRDQEAALRLWERAGNDAGRAEALLNLGMIAFRQGLLADARPLLEESLETARRVGDVHTTAGALLNLGNLAGEERDYERARALYEESLELARRAGEQRRVASALNNLGNVARHLKDFDAATRYHEETRALHREMGDRSGYATSLLNLAEIARQTGQYDRAEALLAESLAVHRDLHDPFSITECLLVWAGVATGRGDLARAATLLGAARRLRGTIHSDFSPSDRERWDAFAEEARRALGETLYAEAVARGEGLSLDAAVAFARASADATGNFFS